MSDEQDKYYEKVKSEYRNNLLNIEDQQKFKTSKLSVLQGLSKLRQISNHPILMDSDYTHNSGKHELLLEKISTGISDGHKILVFSQFVTYLELLEMDLKKSSIPYYKLTGATTKLRRNQYVQEFQKTNVPSVFLISLKAGGVGLNLTAADYVFIADPWWNPAAEAQARDRSHRIGQTKPVFSYKFISRGTIEEKITRLQNQKNKISKDIIHTDGNVLANLNIEDLQLLLD
jgi:SNF2 family DNA or RNA helicase